MVAALKVVYMGGDQHLYLVGVTFLALASGIVVKLAFAGGKVLENSLCIHCSTWCGQASLAESPMADVGFHALHPQVSAQV